MRDWAKIPPNLGMTDVARLTQGCFPWLDPITLPSSSDSGTFPTAASCNLCNEAAFPLSRYRPGCRSGNSHPALHRISSGHVGAAAPGPPARAELWTDPS